MLALIPVAVAIGVSVGRSSNNDDAKLIQALSKSQAQTAGTAAAETTAAANAKTAAKAKKHKSSAKRAGHSSSGGKNAHKPGNITAVPTAAQKKQGAAIVKKLQHTTGTKFLDQLPPEVTIP
jgi:hypothetical protein